MQVKGTGIKTTKEFVKTYFPKDYNQWIESLPLKSKELYSVNTEFSNWFPIKEAYIDPMNKMIEIFELVPILQTFNGIVGKVNIILMGKL